MGVSLVDSKYTINFMVSTFVVFLCIYFRFNCLWKAVTKGQRKPDLFDEACEYFIHSVDVIACTN